MFAPVPASFYSFLMPAVLVAIEVFVWLVFQGSAIKDTVYDFQKDRTAQHTGT